MKDSISFVHCCISSFCAKNPQIIDAQIRESGNRKNSVFKYYITNAVQISPLRGFSLWNQLHLSWVMCWSLLGGAEVECNHHQLIPGSNANLLCWVFISLSSSKSQILSSVPEKRGMQLIFSDNLDTSNILFLYPFPLLKSSGRRSCISCKGFMVFFFIFRNVLPFSSIPLFYI